MSSLNKQISIFDLDDSQKQESQFQKDWDVEDEEQDKEDGAGSDDISGIKEWADLKKVCAEGRFNKGKTYKQLLEEWFKTWELCFINRLSFLKIDIYNSFFFTGLRLEQNTDEGPYLTYGLADKREFILKVRSLKIYDIKGPIFWNVRAQIYRDLEKWKEELKDGK